jgi:hypothetical protein
MASHPVLDFQFIFDIYVPKYSKPLQNGVVQRWHRRSMTRASAFALAHEDARGVVGSIPTRASKFLQILIAATEAATLTLIDDTNDLEFALLRIENPST